MEFLWQELHFHNGTTLPSSSARIRARLSQSPNLTSLDVIMRADPSRSNPVAPHVLSGWKEIACYLGKGVRTVQRYEVELGLPVRRPAGKSCGSVVATKAELDAWVSASPIRDEYHLTRVTASLATSAGEDIKNSVLEMRTLRCQMADLRAELRKSLELLRVGIRGLQGELDEDHWHKNEAKKVTVLDSQFRTKSVFDLLAADVNQRKVS